MNIITILAIAAIVMITLVVECFFCSLVEEHNNWIGAGVNTIAITALIIWIMLLKGVI